MMWNQSGPQEASALSASDLKICDLCGALNLATNRECFICRWHGRFERRADVVNMAKELAERQHGRLEPWLVSGSAFSWSNPRSGFVTTLSSLYHRVKDWILR